MIRIGLLLFVFLPFFCFGQTECFDASADCTFFGSAEFEIEIPVNCGDTIALLPTEQLCNTWEIPDDINFFYGIGSDSATAYIIIDECLDDSILVDGITNTPSGTGIATCNTSFVYTFTPIIDTVEQEISCEAFYALASESELAQGVCGCDSLMINYTTDFSDCIPCNQQCIFIKGSILLEDGGSSSAELVVTYQLNGETLTATRPNWQGRTEELICFNIEDNLNIISVQATLPNGINGTASAEAWIDSNVVVLPELTVPNQQVCIGESIILQAIIDDEATFEWSTGETTSEIEVENEGTYSVTATDENGCTITTSAEAIFRDIELELTASVADPFLLSESPLEVWQGAAVEMSVEVSGTLFSYEILWNKGPEVGDSIYHYIATQNGELTVSVIDSIGCIATKTIEVLVRPVSVYVPNAFSPNGDHINDFLNVFTSPNVEETRLQVFSRIGSLVFDDELPIVEQDNNGIEWQGWDGELKGKLLNQQVFVYLLRYRGIRGEWVFKAGDVVLIKK